MSQYERNLELLNKRRIVYRRDPITDIPDIENDMYMFFENGTYQCYDLFKSTAKITTYKSLKWHLLVLWYLNPGMDQDEFMDVAFEISAKTNGFISFSMPPNLLEKIVGKLIGRSNKTHPDDIYQAMIDIHDLGQKITIKRISDAIHVSPRTVHRYMCEDLKREKELLNKQL